jgi:AraC-like DNA-binding protein
MSPEMPLRKLQKKDLLTRHLVVRTHRPERMRQVLEDLHEASGFDIRSATGRFFGQLCRVQLRHIGIDYSAFGADVALEIPGAPFLRQHICLSGSCEVTFGGVKTQLSKNATCVIAAGTRAESWLRGGFRQLVLRIDPEALHRKFEALIGVTTRTALQFPAVADFRSPQLLHLRRLLVFMVTELDSKDAAPAAVAEMEQALLVAFLCYQNHNLSHLLEKEPEAPSPRQIRNIEAYIEANWNKPLTVSSIAQVSGQSVRSIFNAFKKHKNSTPMNFIRELRLIHSREMLLAAEENNNSVMKIALSCGFLSHGHFAREYQRRFGELPSETLKHWRQQSAEPCM